MNEKRRAHQPNRQPGPSVRRGAGQRTWIKELLRYIRKTWVTFTALAVIICVSVAVLLGTGFSGQAMRKTARHYFDSYHLHDFEIVCRYGITDEDLDALLALDAVSGAEGVYTTTATVPLPGETLLVVVNSLSRRIDQARLTAGSWPNGAGEMVIEEAMSRDTGLKVGDRLTLDARNAEGVTYLAVNEYVISGLVQSPAYINNYSADSRGISEIGNSAPAYYVLALPEAFDAEAFDGCYPKALVTCAALDGLDVFGNAYWAAQYQAEKLLQQLGKERSRLRYARIVADADAEITAARRQLADAEREIGGKESELADAKLQIAAAEGRIASGEDQLDAAKGELYSSQAQVGDAESRLEEARRQLAASRDELDGYQRQVHEAEQQIAVGDEQVLQAGQQLEDANIQIRVAESRVESGEEQLETYRHYLGLAESAMRSALSAAGYDADPETALGQIEADLEEAGVDQAQLPSLQALIDAYYEARQDLEDKEAQLAEAKEELAEAQETYDGYLAQYQDAVRELTNAKNLLQQAKIQVNDGELEYKLGQRQVNGYEEELAQARQQIAGGWSEYYSSSEKLEAGKQELAENQDLAKDGQTRLEEGKNEFAQGQSQVEEAEARLEELTEQPWLITGLKGNSGYLTISTSSANVSGLRLSFALVFMIVAVMVCFTSIGRMVSEQRELLGAQKALGFTRREILRRFMAYTAASSLLGSILGWLAGLVIVEWIALNGYSALYIFDRYRFYFNGGQALLATACAVAVTAALTGFACHKQLGEEATELLRGKKPPQGKTRFFEKYAWWGRQSLYTRSMIKSLLQDKRRFFMTIIGLAGCTALLVISLTMRLAISGVVERQYGGIFRYDLSLITDSRGGEAVTEAFAQRLNAEEGLEYLRVQDKLYYLRGAGGNWSAGHLISGYDLTYLGEYLELSDSVSGAPLAVPFSGALISQRIAEVEGWGKGDAIQLMDSAGDSCTVTIAGIFENYAFHSLVMSADYYQTVTGKPLDDNTFYINLHGADGAQLTADLGAMDGFMRCDDGSRNRTLFDDVSRGIDVLVAVLLVLSAAMAAMVLLDLNFMFIRQKSRELAVMRVNGYSLRETKAYVYRDNIILAALGLLLGVLLGILLGGWVVRGIEEDYIRFIREPIWPACLIAAAIGSLFMVAVNVIALRQVDKLNLHAVSANQ